MQTEFTHLKHIARDRFHSQRALRSPAHITLIPPLRVSEPDCQLLERKIASIAHHTEAFELEIDGVNGFPPRVIYADVIQHQELTALYQQMNSAFQENQLIPTKGRILSVPM